jgi:DNA gyrase subunit B
MADGSAPEGFPQHQARVQEAFAPVRACPGMYIGSVDANGIHHMVEELLDNSIAEKRAGACTRIGITLGADDTVTVEDDGRGIPVAFDPQAGLSALDRTMTNLSRWTERSHETLRYKVAGGWHGVGLAVVTALTEWLEVEVSRDGWRYLQEYARGVPCAPVRVLGEAPGSGTRIRFCPNRHLLRGDLDYAVLDERVRELAYLNAGLELTLRDERPGQPQEHRRRFDKGLVAFVRYLNRHRRGALLGPICIAGTIEGGEVEVALQYSTNEHDPEAIVCAYANNAETSHGGTHLTGCRAGVRQALTTAGRAAALIEGPTSLSDVEVARGLTAVISVHLDQPHFETAVRGQLGNAEVHSAVQRLVAQQLLVFLASHPAQARNRHALPRRATSLVILFWCLSTASAPNSNGVPGRRRATCAYPALARRDAEFGQPVSAPLQAAPDRAATTRAPMLARSAESRLATTGHR